MASVPRHGLDRSRDRRVGAGKLQDLKVTRWTPLATPKFLQDSVMHPAVAAALERSPVGRQESVLRPNREAKIQLRRQVHGPFHPQEDGAGRATEIDERDVPEVTK
jgi:hypothetical protein